MVLLDLLGRRWALRVLWELREGQAMTFRELQHAAGGMSSSVLTARLHELSEAGLVTHAGGYDLTDDGRSLLDLMAPLDAWAEEWSADH